MAKVFVTGRAGGVGIKFCIIAPRAMPTAFFGGMVAQLPAMSAVGLLETSFGKQRLRTVVDHTGGGPQIERDNDMLRDETRTVFTHSGIAQMQDLNA